MLKYCDYCGSEFPTANSRRIYCCASCRRAADNERKRDRRAEESELRAEYVMPDDWGLGNVGEEVMANSLTDGWTADGMAVDGWIDCDSCPDEALGGPLACQQCPHWKAAQKTRKKGRSIDLLCAMCRDGVRV